MDFTPRQDEVVSWIVENGCGGMVMFRPPFIQYGTKRLVVDRRVIRNLERKGALLVRDVLEDKRDSVVLLASDVRASREERTSSGAISRPQPPG